MKNSAVSIITTLASLGLSLVLTTQVFAKPPEGRKPTFTPTPTATPFVRPASVVVPSITLTGGRLTACQSHEKVIQTRMQNLLHLANTMTTTFDSISQRVQEFYKNNVLAKGKSVSDYDTLITDIQKAQTQVQDDVKVAQADADAFICSSADPKGRMTQFRLDMQEVKRALKDYRTTIKNLIVAVKGVTATPTP